MSPERTTGSTSLRPETEAFPSELIERVKQMGTKELPVFYLFRKLTGIRVREGSAMEYVLSVISDTQPQINYVGINGDRICANQIDLLINGIINGYENRSWKNLNPNAPLTPPLTSL